MRLVFLLFTLNAILYALPAFGQKKAAKVDTMAAFRALKDGSRLEKAAKYDSAITYFQQAANGYKAYALSLPDKKKWAWPKRKAWEQHFKAQSEIGLCLLNGNGKSDSALKLLMDAKAACIQVLGETNQVMASIANYIGNVYYNQGQYAQSLEYHQQALAIRKQAFGAQHLRVAASYHNIGKAYMKNGQYAQSLEYHQQALAIRKQAFGAQHPRMASSYHNIGDVYAEQNQYAKALEYYLQSSAIYKRAFGNQHPDLASAYLNIGYMYDIQGQYVQALDYFQQALVIQKQVFGEQHPNVADCYNKIGNIYYYQRDYVQSLKYYQHALAILKQAFGEQHPYVAHCYNNVGQVYIEQGQYTQALDNHQQAFAIRKQVFGEQHPDVAISYNNIGTVYEKHRQYDQALGYYQQALAIQKQAFGEQHPDVGISYNNIGTLYFLKGQYTHAIEQYQQSLYSCLPNYATAGYHSMFTSSPEIVRHALKNLPQILRFRNAPGDDSLALATVRFADRFIDSLRRAYTYENDKLALGSYANQLYQIAIDIAQWNKLDEEAFYYSEKNKAAVLAQSLNEATALKLGGIPDSLLDNDKELRSLVAFYTKASIDEELNCPKCDSTKLTNLKNGLFTYQQQHTAFKTRLESEFAQYFALKYKNANISVKAVQQGFLAENPNSAIIEYLLGDTVLYAFCVTKDKFNFHRQRLDTTRFKNTNSLQLEIKKLSRALADAKLYLDPTTVVSQPASALYEYLIKPFEQQIQGKDLVIIPDAELNKIPFELLMKPNPNLKDVQKWQELPYLIKSHNISYHYSARLLLDDWQKGKIQPVKSNGFLAFAPVFNDTSTGKIVSNENVIEKSYLAYVSRDDTISRAFMNNGQFISPLPGTEREVKAIYALFNQQNQPAKYYLNDQANEATVKSINLKPYKYLHFATHGLTDEDRPTNSCLILAQNKYPKLPSPSGEGPGVGKGEQNPTPNPSPNGEGSVSPDNLLTSSEMYGLELDAELVVLSACQTGKGTLKAGEGIIGLTRGLLYAGARNLMVSQWNVNDASTVELMTKFYSKILAGQSNRQALREAKIELLNSKFACPHYWSAFVLVGR